ncbi:hypothetical protein ACQR1Y_20860 [Bradyrhizobium sp. HKCCYLRH3099]|uniref:hypothetical protein n=1 Tax=unclassified Bradyrhizobium TaxID=2631580 RepID=UPI003EBD2C0B
MNASHSPDQRAGGRAHQTASGALEITEHVPDEVRHCHSSPKRRALLDVARSRIELVQLTVVGGNEPTRLLYESAVFGVQPKAFNVGDRYLNELHMLLDLGRKGQGSARSS